jgi:hypothetical protein
LMPQRIARTHKLSKFASCLRNATRTQNLLSKFVKPNRALYKNLQVQDSNTRPMD